jgi:hypothetical protein
MNGQPGWLVDDEKIRVLIDDVERDPLRPEARRLGRRDQQPDLLSGPDAKRGLARSAVDKEPPFACEMGDPGSRNLRKPLRNHHVEAATAVLLLRLEPKRGRRS